MVISDPVTGDRVVWRGDSRIRAYDKRARLITSIELETKGTAPEQQMQAMAQSLRARRERAVARLRAEAG